MTDERFVAKDLIVKFCKNHGVLTMEQVKISKHKSGTQYLRCFECSKEYAARYQKKYPEKIKAHNLLKAERRKKRRQLAKENKS